MAIKNKGEVFYLVPNTNKKATLINLSSFPTKCSVCHSFQKPDLLTIQYNDNEDAIVQFSCINKSCKYTFTTLYIKGIYGKEKYHFISFV